MEKNQKTVVTIETTVALPAEKAWEYWTGPRHITQWNHASDDWHSPHAENDLRKGGRYTCRMEAKDGSFGFDFGVTYDKVGPFSFISSTMDDGRRWEVSFIPEGNSTKVVEEFEAEETNPVEMQQAGWQAILDNFKKYAESR